MTWAESHLVGERPHGGAEKEIHRRSGRYDLATVLFLYERKSMLSPFCPPLIVGVPTVTCMGHMVG